jgi:hypothetical protein
LFKRAIEIDPRIRDGTHDLRAYVGDISEAALSRKQAETYRLQDRA